MKYFEKDFLQFFKELAANNNREWFQANKARYESYVKKPFEKFVSDLIREIAKRDKSVNITPSDAIFRINKDIRFSKDKTPYKLSASAAISAGGRKSMEDPGIYVELGPAHLALAGGVYMPSKESLLSIREAIASNPKAFMKLLDDKKFSSAWGTLQGEKNKIIDASLKQAATICPWIYNKQFYYWVELKSSIIITDQLMSTILEHHDAAKQVSAFFAKAMK